MLAVVYRPESGVTVEEQPVPVPSAGEALIKVIRAGICCTDIQITQGYGGMYRSYYGANVKYENSLTVSLLPEQCLSVLPFTVFARLKTFIYMIICVYIPF